MSHLAYYDVWNKPVCVCNAGRGVGSTWITGSLPFSCCCHGDNVHIFYSELIRKYNAKCKDNETLQKQQKKCNALLKEYHSKLASAVTKQMPLEEVRNVFCVCWIDVRSRTNVLP